MATVNGFQEVHLFFIESNKPKTTAGIKATSNLK
jgi:hypothetical protein